MSYTRENGPWMSEATMEAAFVNACRLARLGRLHDRCIPNAPYWSMAIHDDTLTVTRHFGGLTIDFELATSSFSDDFRDRVRAIIWNSAQKAAAAERKRSRTRDRRRRGARAFAELAAEYGLKTAAQMLRSRNCNNFEGITP